MSKSHIGEVLHLPLVSLCPGGPVPRPLGSDLWLLFVAASGVEDGDRRHHKSREEDANANYCSRVQGRVCAAAVIPVEHQVGLKLGSYVAGAPSSIISPYLVLDHAPGDDAARVVAAVSLGAAVVRAHFVVERELEYALLLLRDFVKAAVVGFALIAGAFVFSVIIGARTRAVASFERFAPRRRAEVGAVKCVACVLIRRGVPCALVHAPQFVSCR